MRKHGLEVEVALKPISDQQLLDGVRLTPIEEYVIWSGAPYGGRELSIRARVTWLVTQPWTPVPVRELVLRAARLSGQNGISPDRVRGALRMHQRATGASYFLVNRTPDGDFVAVADVHSPDTGPKLEQGDVVLSRTGVRFFEMVQTKTDRDAGRARRAG